MTNDEILHHIRLSLGELDRELARLQSAFIEGAGLIGHFREGIPSVVEYLAAWVKKNPSTTNTGFLTSASNVVDYLKLEAHELAGVSEYTVGRLFTLAQSGDAIASTSAGVAAFDGVAFAGCEGFSVTGPFQVYRRRMNYMERLAGFDLYLGKTYKEVDEILYGTSADPERAAAFSVRQVFDHLFQILAPDDCVRASHFFSPKSQPDSENQVYRRERIQYAIATRVKDNHKADNLRIVSENILEFYDHLQKAHTRGPIGKDEALSAIKAMMRYLELWTDALEL